MSGDASAPSGGGVGDGWDAAPEVADAAAIRQQIVQTLMTIFDPEIPVNIYDLGLIYGVEVEPGGRAKVTMTLTSPNCPEAQSLPLAVKRKTESIAGVKEAEVNIVWEPSWDPSKMSEAAKLALNML